MSVNRNFVVAVFNACLVDKKYERAKTVSKQKLDVSRGKIDAVAVEVKDDFKKLEAVGVSTS